MHASRGINATGRYLDEVLSDSAYKAHVNALYDECVRDRRAIYSEGFFLSPRDRAVERHTKILFMPLSNDGKIANQVFVNPAVVNCPALPSLIA
jgi:hypothetical protein